MTPDQLPARIRGFDAERLEKAVDVLAASVNAATIRAEKAEAEVAALRERVADLEGQLAMRGTP